MPLLNGGGFPIAAVPSWSALKLLCAKMSYRRLIITMITLTSWANGGCAESLFFYHPSTARFSTPATQQDVWFTTSDGVRLHGWFRAGPAPRANPAILFIHGNAGNISSREQKARALADAGFSVLLFDYRSYGRSEGHDGPLNRDLLLADAEAALRYLKSRTEVDAERVGTFGSSLGGVFATALGARDPAIKAVACIGAFSTFQGIAHDYAPILGPLFIAPGLDPANSAELLSVPLLLVHGTADEIVPVEHAYRIARLARASHVPTQLEIIGGGNHNGLLTADVMATIQRFFRRHLIGRRARLRK